MVKRLKQSIELTEQEFKRFLDEMERVPTHKAPIPGKIARLCFEFMEDTGLRVTEAIHVRKKDINFGAKILTVVYPKTEERCKCSTWKPASQYYMTKVLVHADQACLYCHGKGKWKKPQLTTITARIEPQLLGYCDTLSDDQILFPVLRQRLFKWAKIAGQRAGIAIFQQKKERYIDGVFIHLFRELCAKRIIRDAKNDPYQYELASCKLRHKAENVTARYTKVDINYLLSWEAKKYG